MSTEREPEISNEMVKNYIARRKADIVAAREALSSGNFASLDMIGHKLKGNGSLFGFPELSTLGGELEDAAVEGDLEKTKALVSRFDEAVQRIAAEFQS